VKIAGMDSANVFSATVEYDESDPPGYRAGCLRVGSSANGNALAVNVFEMPPGENLCPYHYEYEEEWLLVLEGELLLRSPEGQRTLARGEIVCFPPGPTGAHKLTNTGSATARLVMFSSAREPAVAVYPDSDKIGVWPGSSEDKVMLRRADGAVGYFDGETSG
jgi:uncharacterized cupin superfamily protein